MIEWDHYKNKTRVFLKEHPPLALDNIRYDLMADQEVYVDISNGNPEIAPTIVARSARSGQMPIKIMSEITGRVKNSACNGNTTTVTLDNEIIYGVIGCCMGINEKIITLRREAQGYVVTRIYN